MMTFPERLAAAESATHAVVDLDALAGNATALRRGLPEGAGLMAVVKANAYGHGLVPSARAFLAAGASWLGVARIEEGLVLRAAGVAAPVLVLGPPNPLLAGEAARAGLSLAIGSMAGLQRLVQQLPPDLPVLLPLHLKIDTGMHRFGVRPVAAPDLVRAIAEHPYVHLQGLFTHFACADDPADDFADIQAGRFSETLRELASGGLLSENVYVHLANSAGVLRGLIDPGIAGTTVLARAGIALYGLAPSAAMPLPQECRPALTLRSRVSHDLVVPAGEGISYGLTYRPERDIRCAVLPAGYGDGLSRLLSNQGWALIDGRRRPIRGRVCMDQLVVEVGNADSASPTYGASATLIGDGSGGSQAAGAGAMTADTVAGLTGTINYEVVTAISARVPRVYLRAGRPVAVSDLLGMVEEG